MAGGGGGAVGMRLNIMTALYLPILGYAMSTFELNADALVISSDNLEAYAVPTERTIALGDQFEAKVLYELVPTPEQKARMEAMARGEDVGAEEEGHGAKLFEPVIVIDEGISPEGMYFDSVEKRILFDTEALTKDFRGEENSREYTFKAKIKAKTIAGEGFEKDIEERFTVFKPYIDVQSNAAPRLLANCENSLKFNVPGIDNNSLILNDRASGKIVNGDKITWSPKGDTTTITVSYKRPDGSTTYVGQKGFRITPTPPPIVGFKEEKKPGFLDQGARIQPFTVYSLVVKSEPSFFKDFPKDAKYRIGPMRASITRYGLPPVTEEIPESKLVQFLDNESANRGEYAYKFDLVKLLGKAPNGTGISLYLESVYRINFEGKKIEIDKNSIPTVFSYTLR